MNTPSPGQINLSPDVIFQELAGEMVLLNLKTEHYYGLDETGARMWQLLETHGEVEAVVAQLLAEYEIDEATIRRDLAMLISRFAESGLLTVQDE